MITDALLQRINELARKKRSEGLTAEEAIEQQQLYQVYLKSIREQVTSQLDAAGISPKTVHHHHGPGCSHKKH
ncbi:MAG: DUF896 domain-containing protein [Syntrophomonadaceae bacterium]|jgi:uncharacterized protein YnzC (UPF0291/DUF896 family)